MANQKPPLPLPLPIRTAPDKHLQRVARSSSAINCFQVSVSVCVSLLYYPVACLGGLRSKHSYVLICAVDHRREYCTHEHEVGEIGVERWVDRNNRAGEQTKHIIKR